MRVVERGHKYALQNKLEGEQLLTFFRNLPEDGYHHDGVLCQEVLRVLLDRVLELYRQKPCDEDTQIIQKLRDCLILFETRAAREKLIKVYAQIGQTIEEVGTGRDGHVLQFLHPVITQEVLRDAAADDQICPGKDERKTPSPRVRQGSRK